MIFFFFFTTQSPICHQMTNQTISIVWIILIHTSAQQFFRHSFWYTRNDWKHSVKSFSIETVKICGKRKNARNIFIGRVLKFSYISEWSGRTNNFSSFISILQRSHLSKTVDEDCWHFSLQYLVALGLTYWLLWIPIYLSVRSTETVRVGHSI